jgi:phenylpyruvate tautomerase PptA (4-oxalocrotonate tautomerase family)
MCGFRQAGYDSDMPYLRLSSLPLDETTKRFLADELTATVLDILPGEKPEWTSVHFSAFEPGDFAIAGRLIADGGIPDTHLELSAQGVDEKSWFALRNRLTDVLVEALAIPDSDRWHVNVKLNRYDLHSFAVAGNAADELDFGEGDEGAQPPAGGSVRDSYREGTGKYGTPRRWRIPGILLGFAVGTFLAYRWFAERVATDVTVDAAPPEPEATGTSPSAGAAQEPAVEAPAREY